MVGSYVCWLSHQHGGIYFFKQKYLFKECKMYVAVGYDWMTHKGIYRCAHCVFYENINPDVCHIIKCEHNERIDGNTVYFVPLFKFIDYKMYGL